MSNPDPADRRLLCPACRALVPLDADGHFAAHVGADGAADWCPTSGRLALPIVDGKSLLTFPEPEATP